MEQTPIIVIGGGASGLACADQLTKSGYKCIVYEARDRIGGRILTDYSFAEHPIECGAEFIHGENTCSMKLCQKIGLETTEIIRMPNLYWTDDCEKSPAKFYKDLDLEQQGDFKKMKEVYSSVKDDDTFDSRDISFEEYAKRCSDKNSVLSKANVLISQTWCSPIEKLSSNDLRRESLVDVSGSHEYKVLNGYISLISHFAKNVDIRLSCEVVKIVYDNHGGVVTVMDFAKNESFEQKFSYCVISLPPQLIREVSFAPVLPDRKVDALSSFDMHSGVKIIITFLEKMWKDDVTFLCHDGLFARWWVQSHGYTSNNHTICCYITSQLADRVDKMDDNQVIELAVTELSKLLGFDRNQMEKQVFKTKVHSWAKEKYTRGAYCTQKLSKISARQDLFDPVNNLMFCGETTAYWTNTQTVHGAIESGLKVAENIMKKYLH